MPEPCDGPYALRPPQSAADWDAYHRIRRDVLLEAQKYAVDNPDDQAPGHFPMLLWRDGVPVGSIRIDIDAVGRAGLRLVAVDPHQQKQGCGRALLHLAEQFARTHGCTHTVLYATLDAVGFYAKAGYEEDDWDDMYVSGIVQMAKLLQAKAQEAVE
jgi:GNAT superfamily N-acetyltransferase